MWACAWGQARRGSRLTVQLLQVCISLPRHHSRIVAQPSAAPVHACSGAQAASPRADAHPCRTNPQHHKPPPPPPPQVTGTFHLERLTAIYSSLRGAGGMSATQAEALGSSTLYGHIASLMALRLLSRSGGGGGGGGGGDLSLVRFRCHAALPLVQHAARDAGLDLNLYLQ
jgi:Origin recognition complex (ORC) subunit 5 C-terminus